MKFLLGTLMLFLQINYAMAEAEHKTRFGKFEIKKDLVDDNWLVTAWLNGKKIDFKKNLSEREIYDIDNSHIKILKTFKMKNQDVLFITSHSGSAGQLYANCYLFAISDKGANFFHDKDCFISAGTEEIDGTLKNEKIAIELVILNKKIYTLIYDGKTMKITKTKPKSTKMSQEDCKMLYSEKDETCDILNNSNKYPLSAKRGYDDMVQNTVGFNHVNFEKICKSKEKIDYKNFSEQVCQTK